MKQARIDNYLVILLLFVLVVDPSDRLFKLKIPVFFLVFAVWALQKVLKKEPVRIHKDTYTFVTILFIIPILGLLSGLAQSTIDDLDFAIGFLKSFLVLFLLIITVDKAIPIYKYLNNILLLIPVIIIPIYIAILINPASFSTLGLFFVDNKSEAFFAVRSYFGIPIMMLYYKTSPLLVFPAAFFLNKYYQSKEKKFLIIFLFLAGTLFLSGTRANILITALIIFYYAYNQMVVRKRYFRLIFISAILVFFTVSFVKGSDEGVSDESSQIKSGHLESFVRLFSDHPQYLIWGEGLGSSYYSTGNDSHIVQSELTYIELVRVFGLPLALVFMFILFYPLFYLYHNRKTFAKGAIQSDMPLAYGSYLFIVASNPLLVSSTGLIAIVSIYSYIVNLKYFSNK